SLAGEKEAARLEHAPHVAHHGPPLLLVAGKVEHCAADDDVEVAVGKRHLFDHADAELIGWHPPGDVAGELSHGRDGHFTFVERGDVEAATKEVVEIAPMTAACVEDPHVDSDAAAQQLIEEIDVDFAELAAEIILRMW